MTARRLMDDVARRRRAHVWVTRGVLSVAIALAMAVMLSSSAWAASEACPNAVFRTGFAARLPDCRAYEMVTPPYKEGFAVFVSAVSPEGSTLLGDGLGVFAGVQDDTGLTGAYYTFSRSSSGWAPAAISLSAVSYPVSTLTAASGDVANTLWRAATPSQVEGHAFSETLSDFMIRRPDGLYR